MKSLATRAAGNQATDKSGLAAWEAFQRWLACGERRVVIPYATALADHSRPRPSRLRRDFATLMPLIAAHALLHRGSRPKDAIGRIQATVRDDEVVQDLVAAQLLKASRQPFRQR